LLTPISLRLQHLLVHLPLLGDHPLKVA